MSKVERRINPLDYSPKRFALKFKPAQIVIEYLVPSSGKLYHHKIRVRSIHKDSKMEELMKEIYEKHNSYLDVNKINPNQIVSKDFI
jgi:hypothetical protein